MNSPELGERERVGVVVIHGVGETEPGWINDYVVKRLQEHSPELTFTAHSEVYRLRDRASSEPLRTFDAYTRPSRSRDGISVKLLELTWADLSRVGSNAAASALAAVRLFYEAPRVIGKAALGDQPGSIRGLIGRLTLLANWILRWPATGTNVAALVATLGVLLLAQVAKLEVAKPHLDGLDLFWPIALSLAVASAVGLLMGRRLAGRDIALADVGFSTFIFSLVFLALLFASRLIWGPLATGIGDGAVIYLLATSNLIMPVWLAWTGTIVVAILLLGALGLVRIARLATSRQLPLGRLVVALGLSTLQGMIWKIAVALLWVLLIGAIAQPALSDPPSCSPAMTEYCQRLFRQNARLLVVSLTNAAMALAIGGLFVLSVMLRSAWVRRYAGKLMSLEREAPRLIVSQWIVAAMFALTLLAAYNYYGTQLLWLVNSWAQANYQLPLSIYDWLLAYVASAVQVMLGGFTLTAILVYLRVLRTVGDASRGVLHIARDLVDHQYAATTRLTRHLMPRDRRPLRRYPRRERIQERLRELMSAVAAAERFDRVVLVAHSQGTVILHDYLRSGRAHEDLASVGRIDVVTLASPLTHLYQHYFPAYDDVPSSAQSLHPRLASWTNMWRIDDPIGARVDIVKGGFVSNVALPPGGHLDYWREPQVCGKLAALILATDLPAPPPQAVVVALDDGLPIAPVPRASGARQPAPA